MIDYKDNKPADDKEEPFSTWQIFVMAILGSCLLTFLILSPVIISIIIESIKGTA
jgi:hypothetical protein